MNEIIKMSDKEYFATKGLSNSFLINFDRSPAHAETGIPQTKSMKLGTLLHKFILLEEKEFWKEYIRLPAEMKNDKRLKEHKEFQKLNPSREIIGYDEYIELEQIKLNVLEYDIFPDINIAHILDNSQKETAFFWEENIMGEIVQRKAKLDIFFQSEFYNMACELKKTTDCRDFHDAVKRYQYYRQAATYVDAVKAITGQDVIIPFITIEMSKPYGVMAYQLDNDYIEYGRELNSKSILKYLGWKNSKKKNNLYTNGLHTIYAPNYLNIN